jgi:hypothetical protein
VVLGEPLVADEHPKGRLMGLVLPRLKHLGPEVVCG